MSLGTQKHRSRDVSVSILQTVHNEAEKGAPHLNCAADSTRVDARQAIGFEKQQLSLDKGVKQ
jgi:hypothetical protein